MLYFLIAFIICFLSYFFHTWSHYRGYKGEKSNVPHSIFEIIITVGFFAWGAMLYLDPFRQEIFPQYLGIFGLLLGIAGCMLAAIAAKDKKGFGETDYLVTTGIYSKIRNPLYLGMAMIHIGFPLFTGSILTLLSALLWIPQIIIWVNWEEIDLEKKFGQQYAEYKKRTFF